MSDSLAKLKAKAESVKEYMSLSEIPEQIELRVIGDIVFKNDKRGNEACFITLETRDGKLVVQKYTQTNYLHLYNSIMACGGLEKLQREFHLWVKENVGRSLNPRLFPKPKGGSQL